MSIVTCLACWAGRWRRPLPIWLPLSRPPLGLTRREVEVLGLIRDGKTKAQIADALVISLSTVRRHVEHILRKLEVSSRTAAAVKASRRPS